jgi:hypothetical protein
MNIKNILKGAGGIITIGVLIGLLICVPFATIWAINTLFSTGIPFTFWTWLSVLTLNLTVLGYRTAGLVNK